MIEDDMNPWVLVKKITEEEIAQHLQAAEEARKKKTLEKMALASALLADADSMHKSKLLTSYVLSQENLIQHLDGAAFFYIDHTNNCI